MEEVPCIGHWGSGGSTALGCSFCPSYREGGGEGEGFLEARTLEPKVTHRVSATPPPEPPSYPGGSCFPETDRGGGKLAGADK